MIHLIATVTIQRLNQQKNSSLEGKGGTIMPPLMEEQEHKARQFIRNSYSLLWYHSFFSPSSRPLYRIVCHQRQIRKRIVALVQSR